MTILRNFSCIHANNRSTIHRVSDGATFGPGDFFALGYTRLGMTGLIPFLRNTWRSFFESYPLSACISFGLDLGRPLPLQTLTCSSNSITCSLSLADACVDVTASGSLFPSVSMWMVTPLPLRPWDGPSPPPLPEGKRAVDCSFVPIYKLFCLCHIQKFLLYFFPNPQRLKNTKPFMSC